MAYEAESTRPNGTACSLGVSPVVVDQRSVAMGLGFNRRVALSRSQVSNA